MHECVLFSSYHLAVYESMLIIYLLMRLLSSCLFENVNYLKTGSGSTPLDLIPLMPRMPGHRAGTLFLPAWLTDEDLEELGLGLYHLDKNSSFKGSQLLKKKKTLNGWAR